MNATLASFPFFSVITFAVALLLHPPKSDDKMKKVGNWSELHP